MVLNGMLKQGVKMLGEARQLLTSAGLRLRLLLRLWSLPTVGGACAVPVVLVVSAHGGPPPPPPTSTHQAELPVQPAASNSWPPISTQAFHPPAWVKAAIYCGPD